MSISLGELCSNLIPSARVKVQVTDLKFKVSATGEASNDIVATYTILEGPAAKRTYVETFVEKAASFRLKPFLIACKLDMNREFGTKEEMYQFLLKEAKGKVIMVDMGRKTYNGKEYNEIKDYFPLPESKTTAGAAIEEFGTEVTAKGEVPAATVEAPAATVVDDPLPESLGGEAPKADEMPTLDVTDDDNPF